MELHVQRLITVTPGERTCLACGETFPAGWHCPRCASEEIDEDDNKNAGVKRQRPPSVETVSYLRPEEFRYI